MALGLGQVAALAYGLSDFIAGLLSRRVHYALVARVLGEPFRRRRAVGLLMAGIAVALIVLA